MWHHIPEDWNKLQNCCENLRFHKFENTSDRGERTLSQLIVSHVLCHLVDIFLLITFFVQSVLLLLQQLRHTFRGNPAHVQFVFQSSLIWPKWNSSLQATSQIVALLFPRTSSFTQFTVSCFSYWQTYLAFGIFSRGLTAFELLKPLTIVCFPFSALHKLFSTFQNVLSYRTQSTC